MLEGDDLLVLFQQVTVLVVAQSGSQYDSTPGCELPGGEDVHSAVGSMAFQKFCVGVDAGMVAGPMKFGAPLYVGTSAEAQQQDDRNAAGQ
jgi:hypothetical protein